MRGISSDQAVLHCRLLRSVPLETRPNLAVRCARPTEGRRGLHGRGNNSIHPRCQVSVRSGKCYLSSCAGLWLYVESNSNKLQLHTTVFLLNNHCTLCTIAKIRNIPRGCIIVLKNTFMNIVFVQPDAK